MKMKRIDLQGLACPQPVIRTRNALKEGGFARLEVIVDNDAALANVTRFAEHSGYQILGTEEQGGSFIITIAGGEGADASLEEAAYQIATANCPLPGAEGSAEADPTAPRAIYSQAAESARAAAPAQAAAKATASAQAASSAQAGAGKTLFIASDTLGEGAEELGHILMKAFLYALTELEHKPRRIIFMNSGVKLAVQGAAELEDLRSLEGAGVEIIACGTCLEYYQLKDRLQVGIISNMYDIADFLLGEEVLTI